MRVRFFPKDGIRFQAPVGTTCSRVPGRFHSLPGLRANPRGIRGFNQPAADSFK